MKNVTKILTAVTFCAALFASDQRIDALGGNAAFWPGDEANIAAFPAQVNNHSYLQFTGVGGDGADPETFDGGGSASILWQDAGTTWGFNYGGGDWVNMHWGDGSMGVSVGFSNDTDSDGEGTSDFSAAYGNTFDWGEIGVKYWTWGNGDDADLGFNYRSDFGFWLFDNTAASVYNMMCEDCDMVISADFFSHMDAGGADVVYGWGFDYDMGDAGGMGQTATIGVEANMTDWATLRAGVNWNYELSNEDSDVVGNATTSYAWGLGFNWGGLTADVTVDSGLFQDPIGAITGYDDGGLTNSTVTLTYSF